MAKTAAEPPGRSGSQFFVVTQPDAGLTPDYALIGRVTSGWTSSTGSRSYPRGQTWEPVLISRITIEGEP